MVRNRHLGISSILSQFSKHCLQNVRNYVIKAVPQIFYLP